MFNENGPFLLALFEIFLFFAWFMCLFWIFGDIFRSKDLGGVARTLWVLFVIFVPWLGILVYLIVRWEGHAGSPTGAGHPDATGPGRVHQVRGRQLPHRCRRPDRVSEWPTRHRCNHPSRVPAAQGEGSRHLNTGPRKSAARCQPAASRAPAPDCAS